MYANEVGRLIRGSHNIDRMRKEIGEVMGMIMGYAIRIPRAIGKRDIAMVFETSTCKWEVIGLTGCMGEVGQLTTYCWVRLGNTQGRFLAYSSNPKVIPFHTENVQDVYESLPDFVAGMLNILPELGDKLLPLFKASEAVFVS